MNDTNVGGLVEEGSGSSLTEKSLIVYVVFTFGGLVIFLFILIQLCPPLCRSEPSDMNMSAREKERVTKISK